MSFRERIKQAVDSVRDDEQTAESKRKAAIKRREEAKRRAKRAARAAKSRVEAAGEDVKSPNRSRTKEMFARAERTGRASAPVDATIEPMGSPESIRKFAEAGDGGTPTGETKDSGMAAGMEDLVLGIGPAAEDEETEESTENPLEFGDSFGVTGGFGGDE